MSSPGESFLAEDLGLVHLGCSALGVLGEVVEGDSEEGAMAEAPGGPGGGGPGKVRTSKKFWPFFGEFCSSSATYSALFLFLGP